MSKHRVLSFKPQLRLEWRGQDGQNETEQADHSASLRDSITSSTQMRFSVHTVTEPGRYMFKFGWLIITADDLAIWRQFPNAAFTLFRTANETEEEYRLGAFELPGSPQK